MKKPIFARNRDWRYWLRLLAVGLLGGLVMLVGGYLAVYIHYITLPAPTEICCITPADLNLPYEEVQLETPDGITLTSWYIPSQNGAAVILLHGYGANRTEMIWRAGMLATRGYGALLYDLRAHGTSGGELRSWGWLNSADLPAAVAWLQARPEVDPERIGVLGFSVGGQIAIRAAAELPAIKAVVADGTGTATSRDYPPPITPSERWLIFPSGRLLDAGLALRLGTPIPDPVATAIGQIAPRPLLLIAATGDEEEARLSRNYFALAAEPKELWEIPEAGHGGGPQARPDEYQQRIIAFFDQALNP